MNSNSSPTMECTSKATFQSYISCRCLPGNKHSAGLSISNEKMFCSSKPHIWAGRTAAPQAFLSVTRVFMTNVNRKFITQGDLMTHDYSLLRALIFQLYAFSSHFNVNGEKMLNNGAMVKLRSGMKS